MHAGRDTRAMKVGFFGAYDPAYPRNRILREGLVRAGHPVIEVRVRETRAFRRYPALATEFAKHGVPADVLFVPEFRHKDVPLARALARRHAGRGLGTARAGLGAGALERLDRPRLARME